METLTTELVVSARAGDAAALEELVRASLPVVYNVVGRALGGGTDVDDTVQETMVRLLSSLDQLRESDRYRSWLVTIAMRLVRDRWRSRQHTPDVSVTSEELDWQPEPGTCFEELAIWRLRLSGERKDTARALTWLDPQHRETATLWWLELAGEIDRAGLATALGLSGAQSAVRVQRMRDQLETCRGIVAVLRGRANGGHCAGLDEVLAGSDGHPSPLLRKRLARHLRDCRTCGREDGERRVPCEGLLTGLGLLPVPGPLGDSVQATAQAALAMSGTVRVPSDAGRAAAKALTGKTATAAAASVAALALGVIAFAGPGTHPGAPAPAPAPRPEVTRAEAAASLTGTATSRPRAVEASRSQPRTKRTAPLPTRMTAPPVVRGSLPQLADTAYAAPAHALYLSPSGRDSAPGTESRPLRSLAGAVQRAKSGDTLVFKSGVCRTGDVSFSKKLTLQPVPHAKVWLLGSTIADDWRAEDGNWCIPWHAKNLSTPKWEEPDKYVDPAYPSAARREMVFRDGSALGQVVSTGDLTTGTFVADTAAHKLCVADAPEGHRLETTVHAKALGAWGSDAAGTTIRGIGFAHYGGEALQIGTPRAVVEKVTSVRNAISGLTLSGSGSPTDAVIRDSVFSYNGRKGLGGGKADRLRLEHNVFAANNTEGFRTNWDAAGAKIIDSTDITAHGNSFVQNYGHALWLDVNTRDATVVANYSVANHDFGLFFEISRGARLAGNVAANNGVGIGVANSSGARVSTTLSPGT
ncbi:sigma-70 family RNA polymerase sigma factor [Streptomyces sp. NPDC001661]